MSTFKVGDWVTIKSHEDNVPHQITEIDENDFLAFLKGCAPRFIIDLEHWTPQLGEWCWIKDTNMGLLMVVQYDDGILTASAICEPFIGQLPSWVKE